MGRRIIRARDLFAATALALLASGTVSCLQPASAQAARTILRPTDTDAVRATIAASDLTERARARAASNEINALNAKLESLGRELRAAKRANTKGEIDRLTAELAATQAQMVTRLAQRDAEYARLIAEFRDDVVQLASSPQAAEILGQRSRGDLAASRQKLDALIRQRNKAGGSKTQFVADLRALAALAVDDRGFGEATTRELLDRFEELAELEPNHSATWTQLAKLYRESGQLSLAAEASKKAGSSAGNDWDRGEAYAAAADLAAQQGDYKAMNENARKSVEFRRKLAGGGDPAALRNLSQTLLKVANAESGRGDYLKTRPTLQESLAVARQLSALNPSSRDLRRDMSGILRMLGFVELQLQNLDAGIKAINEAHAIQAELLKAEPNSEPLLNEYFQSLRLVSGFGPAQDPKLYAEAMSSRNPNSPAAQKILTSARHFVEIAERRVALDRSSPGYQRDLVEARNTLTTTQTMIGGPTAGSIAASTDNAAAASRIAAASPQDGSLKAAANQSWEAVRTSYLVAAFTTKDKVAAVKLLDDGIVKARKGVADSKGDKQWQLLLVDLIQNRNVYRMMDGNGDLGPFVAGLTEQKAILEKLLKAEPNDYDLKKKLDETSKSLSQMSQAAAMARSVPGGQPAGNPEARRAARDFKRGPGKQATMAFLQKTPGSEAQLNAAIAEARKQAGPDPVDEEWADVFVDLYKTLWSGHYSAKNYAKAKTAIQAEISLLEKLNSKDGRIRSELDQARASLKQVDYLLTQKN